MNGRITSHCIASYHPRSGDSNDSAAIRARATPGTGDDRVVSPPQILGAGPFACCCFCCCRSRSTDLIWQHQEAESVPPEWPEGEVETLPVGEDADGSATETGTSPLRLLAVVPQG
jgi:hypothetical protein